MSRSRTARVELFDEPVAAPRPELTYDERMRDMRARSERSTAMLQNAKRTAAETEAIGVATLAELERQGDVIDGLGRKLDKVDADLHQAGKHLNSIESIFGGIRNLFVRAKPPTALGTSMRAPRTRANSDPARPEAAARPEAPRSAAAWFTGGSAAAGPAAASRSPAVRFGDPTLDAEYSKQDETLDEMGEALARMKSLGTTIGKVTDDHIERLENTTYRVDRTAATLDKSTARVVRATRW
eukprot:c52411_g1_i1.p1 GENE.c52411_g1_i1~~c52411_g1_i1.p1  ORF type:complete len:241 (+),score=27.33 c52411_g1_i1:133-855(+)